MQQKKKTPYPSPAGETKQGRQKTAAGKNDTKNITPKQVTVPVIKVGGRLLRIAGVS